VNDPLTGKGILVTRPSAQSGELMLALTAAGGTALQLPVIEIVPRNPEAVKADLAGLPISDIVIFVSRNAVTYGVQAFSQQASAMTKIAAIGQATQSALVGAGFEVHICPDKGFDSEHLLAHAQLQDVAGKQVLIVRGNSGRELLADTLRRRGAKVDYLSAYERKTATPDDRKLSQLIETWQNGAIDEVIIMSVDSLTSLMKILPTDSHHLLRKTRLVTPSKRVIQTATESLPGVRTMLAESPRVESLVNAIIQMPQQRNMSKP
jgi:uroporphyrinogen-III synthase